MNFAQKQMACLFMGMAVVDFYRMLQFGILLKNMTEMIEDFRRLAFRQKFSYASGETHTKHRHTSQLSLYWISTTKTLKTGQGLSDNLYITLMSKVDDRLRVIRLK